MSDLVAGIDMGSNAIRVTIANPPKKKSYHKPIDVIEKYRFPCRLGNDVFKSQTISEEKEQQLIFIFHEIQKVLEKHQVKKLKAVATSAFRDSDNGRDLLKYLSGKFKIPARVISGKLEAQLMSQGMERRGHFVEDAAHLHVDIGGGSLELSLHYKGKFIFQKSLDVGTLRLLVDTRTGQLIANHSKQLNLIDPVFKSKEAQKIIQKAPKFLMHGTGGNFRRLGRLRKFSLDAKKENYLKKEEVPQLLGTYMNYSGFELARHLPLKEENASLIIPSLLMIQRVLHHWPARLIKIPKISLSHALIDELS